VATGEGFDLGSGGWFTDPVGYVDSEKIAGIKEAVDGFEIDVVGVDMVRPFPAKVADGVIGGCTDTCRFGANDVVFAIGFIPNRDDFNALFLGQDAGLELRFRLMRKPVANTQGVLTEQFFFHSPLHPSD
jgi:hypothetical protein